MLDVLYHEKGAFLERFNSPMFWEGAGELKNRRRMLLADFEVIGWVICGASLGSRVRGFSTAGGGWNVPRAIWIEGRIGTGGGGDCGRGGWGL